MKQQFQFHVPVKFPLSSGALWLSQHTSRNSAFGTVNLDLTPRNIQLKDRLGELAVGMSEGTDSFKVTQDKLTCEIYKLYFFYLTCWRLLQSCYKPCWASLEAAGNVLTLSHKLHDLNIKLQSIGGLCFLCTFCTLFIGWSFAGVILTLSDNLTLLVSEFEPVRKKSVLYLERKPRFLSFFINVSDFALSQELPDLQEMRNRPLLYVQEKKARGKTPLICLYEW